MIVNVSQKRRKCIQTVELIEGALSVIDNNWIPLQPNTTFESFKNTAIVFMSSW